MPSYDELSIFLTCLIFLLLFFLDGNCRTEILNLYKIENCSEAREFLFGILIVYGGTILFLIGITASIFHILIPGKKDMLSETGMKFFALAINGIAGIKSGLYIVENQKGWLILFPAWNILMGIFLIYSIGLIDEVEFDQTDATFKELYFSIVALIIIFFFCYAVFQLYWAIVLSICIDYALGLNKFVIKTPGLIIESSVKTSGH